MNLVPVIPPITDPIEALGEAVLAFLVGKYIQSAATQADQLAKAKSLLSITQALIEVNSDQAIGVTDLQTAIANLVSTVKDPAGALAVNELLAVVSGQLTQLEGTIIGKLQGVTANLIVTQIASVAQYYVTLLTPAS